MKIVGIDPGMDGAICVLNEDRSLSIISCPTFELKKAKRDIDIAGLCAFFRALDSASTRVFLERAQFMPGQGGSSSFNYGTGFGAYKGIIAMAGLPLELVAPVTWKKAMRIGADKAEALRRASMLMPAWCAEWTPRRLVFDKQQAIGRAEAALIAWWGADKIGAMQVGESKPAPRAPQLQLAAL
jgi:crossover junction endodeoxyribonuclease RuvC